MGIGMSKQLDEIYEKVRQAIKQSINIIKEIEELVKSIDWLKNKITSIRNDLKKKLAHGRRILEWSKNIFKSSEESDLTLALGYLSRSLDKLNDVLKDLDKSIEYLETALALRRDIEFSLRFLIYSTCMNILTEECLSKNKDKFSSKVDLENYCLQIVSNYRDECHNIAKSLTPQLLSAISNK